MKKLFLVVLATLLLFASCEEAGKVNYDSLEMIEWKGNFSEAPVDPEKGWMYYNTVEDITYLFDGLNWKIVSKDTQRVSITIDGEEFIGTYYFPFDGEIVVTKTITITNTGTIDVFFDEDGPVIDSEDNALCSKAEIVAPSWKSCLKPKESQSFIVRFIRDEDTLYDCSYITINILSSNNPLFIHLVSEEIQEVNKTPIAVEYGTFTSWDFCHPINQSDSAFMLNPVIDFGNTMPGIEYGVKSLIFVRNNTADIIKFDKNSIAWIDGADYSSFLFVEDVGTVVLYPNERMPLLLIFAPDSLGEKKATLHISYGNDSKGVIDIKLHGNATEKLFDESGCMMLNGNVDKNNLKLDPLIAGGVDGVFYVLKSNVIREYSSQGELLEVYEMPSSERFESLYYKDGKFYLYFVDYYPYSYSYSVFNPVSNTFEEEHISCSEEEYREATGNGNGYLEFRRVAKRIKYGEYCFDFIESFPDILFILKGEERIGSIVGVVEYNSGFDYCVSGDYLYYTNHCYVKRINIQEILDSFGL